MIIGFTGRINSGKTTLAKYLENEYEYKKVSFATPLKEAVRVLYQFTDRQLYGDLKEAVDPRIGMTPRYVLQYIGTDLFRKWNPDFWVNIFKLHYDNDNCDRKLINEEHIVNYVLDDVRFENEAKCIKELGGIIVKVVSHKYQKISSHESENGVKNYDYKIYNDGSIEDLYEALHELLHYNQCNNGSNNENN